MRRLSLWIGAGPGSPLICGTAEPEEEMQARHTFDALRRLGKRVELRLYRDEDHDPGAWTEASHRDASERILAWFDTFAKSPK